MPAPDLWDRPSLFVACPPAVFAGASARYGVIGELTGQAAGATESPESQFSLNATADWEFNTDFAGQGPSPTMRKLRIVRMWMVFP